jgi:hypothetical protein
MAEAGFKVRGSRFRVQGRAIEEFRDGFHYKWSPAID